MIRRPAACLLAAVLALTLLPGAALAGGDEYIRLPTGVTEDIVTYIRYSPKNPTGEFHYV